MEAIAKSLKTVDDDIAELNSAYTDLSSGNQQHVQDINLITEETDELGKINNESVIVESFEKLREETKELTEMNNKMQKFRNQIVNVKSQQDDYVKKIQWLEVELSNKKSDLNSVVEECQMKKMAMESEFKRGAIHAANLEKKLEVVEQNVEALKLYQEQLITKGIEVIEFIKNT